MAHLWLKDDSDGWAVLSLDKQAYTLATNPPRPVAPHLAAEVAASRVLLLRAQLVEGASWVLLAKEDGDVFINGSRLSLGIRVIADRDEIRVRDLATIYFSTESLPAVAQFPGAEKALFCPRCRMKIEEGRLAVRCPSCGVWHHQTDDLPCWTYAEVCALCPQPTDLDAGFRWTPEEL
jgi:hypothetical protein